MDAFSAMRTSICTVNLRACFGSVKSRPKCEEVPADAVAEFGSPESFLNHVYNRPSGTDSSGNNISESS